jgi:hypothetical protein
MSPNPFELLREQIESAGGRIDSEESNRLKVTWFGQPYLLKRIYPDHLREQAYLVSQDLDEVTLENRHQYFTLSDAANGAIFQVIPLKPDWRRATQQELLKITELYRNRDRFAMLTPRVTLQQLLDSHHDNLTFSKAHGHPDPRNTSLEPAKKIFEEVALQLFDGGTPAVEKLELATGFVHEDLSTHNVLMGDGRLRIIDFDPILHSYSLLNLSYLFAVEIVFKGDAHNFHSYRSALVSELASTDQAAFDYFTALSMYRVLIRRAFHRDYHHEDWLSEFEFLFSRPVVDFLIPTLKGRK